MAVDNKISLFDPLQILNGRLEESSGLELRTSFQIVDQANGDDFRAAAQAVVNVARGNLSFADFTNGFGENKKLGLEVTSDLAEIISAGMELSYDEMGDRTRVLTQRARGTIEAINSSLEEGESWQELLDTYKKKASE